MVVELGASQRSWCLMPLPSGGWIDRWGCSNHRKAGEHRGVLAAALREDYLNGLGPSIYASAALQRP
jgi:hypothetical protein